MKRSFEIPIHGKLTMDAVLDWFLLVHRQGTPVEEIQLNKRRLAQLTRAVGQYLIYDGRTPYFFLARIAKNPALGDDTTVVRAFRMNKGTVYRLGDSRNERPVKVSELRPGEGIKVVRDTPQA